MDKKQIQVLLLEDEAAHAEAIRRALESANGDLKLHIVGSLKGFRDYIAADTPDIALVDMVLPDGNGIDLLTYPPESKAFPMLILTSHGNEKAAVDALKAGALDYVVKSPETFAAMSRILTRNLNQWSLIQERKKAEAALQASEENFRNSMDNSLMGIRITDADENTLYLNKAFLNILGYENIDEVRTMPPLKYYTPASYAGYLQRKEKFLHGEPRPDRVEVDIIRKDGAIRHLQLSTAELVWNGKQQFQTIYTDITERKQAEAALQQSEITLHNFLDNSVMGVRIREDDNILYLNQAFLDIFGYQNREEAELTSPLKSYTPESYADYVRRAEKLTHGEIVSHKIEVDIIRKDGTIRHLQVYGKNTVRNGRSQGQTIYNDITERVQAEAALKVSEQNFRNSMDSSTMGIRIMGNVDNTIYANQAMLDMFGYQNIDELNASPPQEHYTPESHADFLRRKEQYVRGELLPARLEFDIIRADGAVRNLQLSSKNVFWDGKQQFQLIYIDMTEHKQAEATLRQSENKYRELTESISDVFFAMDNDLRYTHWNKASEKLTGILAADALGRRFSDIFPENEANRSLQEMYLKAIKMQQSQHFISKYPGKQNKIHEITVYPAKDGISVFTKDITERTQMEEVLRESELRFRTLIEKAPIAIDISRDGKVLYANKKLVELMRESNPEKNVGRPVTDFFVPELREESQTRSKLHSSGLPAPENFESKLQREDGSQIPVQIQRSQLQLSDGMANIAFITDITERKDAENKRHQIEEKAQITSRLASVGEMAAGIAHEINNPLTAVLGFSQIILEGKNVPEDIRENITIIANESQRVANIVRRLLTFARQTKPVKTSVNLNEVIDNTLKLRQYVLKTANISAITNYDPELPCLVVDPGQMQQVFLNLIVNAEQAMKKAHGKGILKITTEKKDNYIRISFRDDGPGITKENMGHLFEPFFTTKDIGEGTGLGLSLSRSIILEHGGKMRVESESGLGATFIVELPVVDAAPPGPENACAITEIQPSPEKSGRILVVDDEPGIRALLEKVLTQIGYIVDTITNPKIVKDKLNAGERYDAILLDIRMPGMSGTELYSHIIENMPVLKGKIIIITGDVMGPDIKDFLTKNNLPYLVKPFDIKLLKEKINEIIGSGQSVA
jgi:PAS domain S-box-containing protein